MVPERRSVLVTVAGFCSLGLAGCSALDGPSETDPESATETTAPSGRRTSESTATTAPGTPTATLRPTGTETPTATASNARISSRDDGVRFFGGSIGISGDTAIVGAQGTDPDLHGLASVFVRANGSWSQQAQLVSDTGGQSDDRLPVAVSGDVVLVGNTLYARSGGAWTRETALRPDEDVSLNTFDLSVAIDDDTAVVGKPNDEGQGDVYVFQRSDESWEQQVTLVHPDGKRDSGFGAAVSIAGDTVVVGSPGDDTSNGDNTGSAHVFTRSRGRWRRQATLTLDEGDDNDWFGTSVSLSEDTVIVGANRDEDPNDESSGSAHVFERRDGDWRQQVPLLPTDETRDDWLGNYGDAVSVADGTALLSGSWNPTPQIQNGVQSAFLFSRDGGSWPKTRSLEPGRPDSGATVGPVALSGDTALVGAPMGNETTETGGHGVVYVYRL